MSRYEILTDIHCHTNVSDHAHSSFEEMVYGAQEKGMELIAITNHGPELAGDGAHPWHFMSLKNNAPSVIKGVKILKGIEANIMGYNGSLDMADNTLRRLDVVIASMHGPCIEGADRKTITETWLKVMENPYVDILGHSGQPKYPYDLDTVLSTAREKNVWVEINNHSFQARSDSADNCRAIALGCKELGVKVVVNSDSHSRWQIGDYPHVYKMFEEIDFPQELIVNRNAEVLLANLAEKRPHIKELF